MKSQRIFTVMVVITLLMAGIYTVDAQHRGGHDDTDHNEHIMINPGEMEWSEGPASLNEGAKYSLIEGDWTREGPFTARLKLPAGFKINPHWHPAIEHVTVLKGSFYMGDGEHFDENNAKKLEVGGFAVMPVEYVHYAFTREEAVIQLHGIGPWGINYVNEDDDPRIAGR